MASLRFAVLLSVVLLVAAAAAEDTSDGYYEDVSHEGEIITLEKFENETVKDDGTMKDLEESLILSLEAMEQEDGDDDDNDDTNNSHVHKRSPNHSPNTRSSFDYGRRYPGYYLPTYRGSYPGSYSVYQQRRGYPGSSGRVSYYPSYARSPVLTFVKGFKPGKSYVEKGRIVRNYYRHGTYEVALQNYRFIPVIKVVPFTTYKTVGYTGHIQARHDYTANVCKDCYHGNPKIDIVANETPYNHIVRRFVYLPQNYRIGGIYEDGNSRVSSTGYAFPGSGNYGSDDGFYSRA